MNILMNTPPHSLRNQPQVAELFERAGSRHLDDAELQRYTEMLPNEVERANAAREIQKVESQVLEKTVMEVLAMYPLASRTEGNQDRCFRDEGFVSAYATNAMLLNDVQWLQDKFLVWFKTIVDTLNFPPRSAAPLQPSFINPFPEITRHADTLPENIAILHDTYARMRAHYEAVLTPTTWSLMGPVLDLVVDTMSRTRK